jgi:hypothetical protein
MFPSPEVVGRDRGSLAVAVAIESDSGGFAEAVGKS